tara:strand:- start:479 stop:1039 length:561 start_codon:yes stop_codon:yes gene_type:complete
MRIPVYILAIAFGLIIGTSAPGCATGSTGKPLTPVEKFDRAESTIRTVLPMVSSSYGLLAAAGVTPEEITLIRAAHDDFESGLYKALAAARLRLLRKEAGVAVTPMDQAPDATAPEEPDAETDTGPDGADLGALHLLPPLQRTPGLQRRTLVRTWLARPLQVPAVLAPNTGPRARPVYWHYDWLRT